MSQTDSPLGTAPVGKLVLQLAIPAMLAQFVNILYSVVDRMYVGHIAGAGDAALAGVGVCAPVVTMITAIGALIGFGGGPLMSIRMGRRDMDGARQIITNSFYLLLALSVLATVPLLIFKRQILFAFGCSEVLWDYAQAYFTTYVSGTVFALLSYGLNQITMSQGFSGTAMRSVMLGATVNIALDPVFIFALDMGVRGAALATVLSQACSTAYIRRFLMSDRAAVRITRQQAILGYNYGACDEKRVMKAFRCIVLLCLVFCGIMFLLAQTVSGAFVKIFTKDPAYIDMAAYMIRTYSLGVLGLTIQYPFVDGMTGMGLVKWGLTFSMLRKGIFLVSVFVLPPIFGATAVMFSEPLSDVVSAVFSGCAAMFLLPKLVAKQCCK